MTHYCERCDLEIVAGDVVTRDSVHGGWMHEAPSCMEIEHPTIANPKNITAEKLRRSMPVLAPVISGSIDISIDDWQREIREQTPAQPQIVMSPRAYAEFKNEMMRTTPHVYAAIQPGPIGSYNGAEIVIDDNIGDSPVILPADTRCLKNGDTITFSQTFNIS